MHHLSPPDLANRRLGLRLGVTQTTACMIEHKLAQRTTGHDASK